MNNNKWHGILKIITTQHRSESGELLWEEANVIRNLLHVDGEAFILKALFTGQEDIPDDWFIGLDGRNSLNINQTMSDVSEPSGNGYERQSVPSSGQFVYADGEVIGPIVTFRAVGGSFTAKNVFFSDMDTDGTLISSAALTSARTVLNGQTLSVKVSFALSDG
jgi:hypothetical protein